MMSEKESMRQALVLDPYHAIRERRMRQVLVSLSVLVSLQIPLQLALGPASVAAAPALFVLLYLFALALLQRGHQQLAASVLVWSSLVVLGVIFPLFGGLHGTVTIFIELGAIVAVLWLERPHAIIAIIAHALLLAALSSLDAVNTVPQLIPPEQYTIAMFISYLLATSLAAMLAGSTTDALAEANEIAALRGAEALEAQSAAENAMEAKSRFLATMSHELRTPLNAIIGYAEMLGEDADAEDFGRIYIAGRQLLTLVDDVLEVARSEANPRSSVLSNVDLRTLIEQTFGSLTAISFAHGMLHIEGQRTIHATDPILLERVISNLLIHTGQAAHNISVTLSDRSPLTLRCPACKPGVHLELAQRFAAQLRSTITAIEEPNGMQFVFALGGDGAPRGLDR